MISQSRTVAAMEQQRFYGADPLVADLMMRAARGDTDLGELDVHRFRFLTSSVFLLHEDQFRQYGNGLISEAQYSGFVKRITQGFRRAPGYRAMWALQRDGFEADFQAFMDEVARSVRHERGASPELLNAWQTAIAEELEGQSR